jgi:hypothetical protein
MSQPQLFDGLVCMKIMLEQSNKKMTIQREGIPLYVAPGLAAPGATSAVETVVVGSKH